MEDATLFPQHASPMNKPTDEVHHLAYIDTVRGLAFLAVFGLHTCNTVGWFPGKWLFSNGFYGVELFFMASAITLCYSAAERSHREARPWLFFYIRRLFRIAPLFWFAILFYWNVPGSYGESWRESTLQHHPATLSTAEFLADCAVTAVFMHGWNPYTFNFIVPGGWSIAVEMTFYVFFPLLFLYLNSWRKSMLAIIISLVVILIIGEIFAIYRPYPELDPGLVLFFQRYWFPTSLSVFLMGFCTYYFLRGKLWSELRKSRAVSIGLFLVCVSALVLLLDKFVNMLLIEIALAGLIVSLSSPRLPLVVNPVLGYVGKISFSCYLVHFYMIVVALKVLNIQQKLPGTMSWAEGNRENLHSFLLVVSVALPLTLLASTLTWHAIEKPGIAAGKWVIRKMGNRSGGKSVAMPK
jgi:peptidoglycan/LPS O-acetylase OafA/YrhL